MNELKLTNLNGIETVDSRQVAEAVGKELSYMLINLGGVRMKTFYYLGTIMFAYAAIAFLGIAIFVNPEDKTEYLPWIWLSVIGLFNRTVYLESEVDRGSRITDNRSARKEV